MVVFERMEIRTPEYKKFIEKAFSENGLRCYFEPDSNRYLQIHTKKFSFFNSLVGYLSRPSFLRKPSDLEIELVNEKYKDAVMKSGELVEKEFQSKVTVIVYE